MRSARLPATTLSVCLTHLARFIQSHLGVPQSTAARRLKALADEGLIEGTRPGTSSRQSYRLTQPEEN
jgi:DNA-binding MarR family transcriptional regulator